MSSSSPSSSVTASESGGRSIRWVLHDRAPRDVDLGSMMASDADVLLVLLPPPAVSTAFLDQALVPDASAWETTRAPCRVEGADVSGRLLLALPLPRAPGESNLLVCRPVPVPVPSGAAKAKGKAEFLPAFPEDALGVAISLAAPTGIIAARNDDYYFVAQLHRAPPSSSPHVVAIAVCYSSQEKAWTMSEVLGGDRWHGFRATFVVAHHGVDHTDARCLLFVDPRRGLLVFDPRAPTASRFVGFPEGVDGGELDQGGARVDSADGRIVYLGFYEERTRIGLWWLSEDELRWCAHLKIHSDEVLACDHRLLPLQGAACVRAVDPYKMTRIFFAIGHPTGDGMSSFCVEVSPTEMVFRRVKFVGDVESSDCNCLDTVVYRLGTATRSWKDTAVYGGQRLGMLALTAAREGRKYVHKLPGAVELVAGALSLPHAGALITAANAVKNWHDILTLGQNISFWLRTHWPFADAPVYRVVGTIDEAEAALNEWLDLHKPSNMLLDPAPGLTEDDWRAIRVFLAREGGATLVQHNDYEVIQRAPR